LSALAQSKGARQVPSLLVEEVQPERPPSKPRAAAAGGYLLFAAPALAGSASRRLAVQATAKTPSRISAKRIGFSLAVIRLQGVT
jgi:hypothetical protein